MFVYEHYSISNIKKSLNHGQNIIEKGTHYAPLSCLILDIRINTEKIVDIFL